MTKATSKREVKVVDFSSLSHQALSNGGPRSLKKEGRGFLSSKASNIHDDSPLEESKRSNRNRAPSNASFLSIAKEVEALGASNFDKKSQKAYKISKIVEMGGQAPKNIKTPINILRGQRKKAEQRLERQREEDKASGMYSKGSDLLRKKDLDKRNKAIGKNKGINLNQLAGKYKNGVLHVNPDLLRKKGKGGKGSGRKK